MQRGTTEVNVTAQVTGWSGPLPHPEALQQFENIEVGLATRIVRMAEDEGAHRREKERTELTLRGDILRGRERRESRNTLLGIICAAFIALVTIGCATFLAYSGHTLTGFGIIIANLVALTGAFLYGHQRKAQTNKTPE